MLIFLCLLRSLNAKYKIAKSPPKIQEKLRPSSHFVKLGTQKDNTQNNLRSPAPIFPLNNTSSARVIRVT